MKKFLFCIVALCFVFAAGSAMAFDEVDHIKVAPNSQGDVVIFPVVLGSSEPVIKTKIVVTNTSETLSAVAKVVFREGKYSQEILDFLIYLSPADVWWGEIYYDAADGKVKVFSTDGSGPSSSSGVIFATTVDPLDQPFIPVACAPGSEEIVYCEVIGTWTSGVGDLGIRPCTKVKIKAAFDIDAGPYDCENILTGHYESYVSGAITGANRALVFADYDNEEKLTPQTPTFLGAAANNNLCEIEAALSKENVAMPYYNNSSSFAVHWNTFITKQSIISASCAYVTPFVRGPFFDPSTDWITDDDLYCVIFKPLYFDLEENAPGTTDTPFSPYSTPDPEKFCWEVNYMFTIPPFIDSNYEEGWVRYRFGATTTCTPEAAGGDVLSYTGAPTIPTVWFYTVADGLSILDAAYTDGTVIYNAVTLPYYQYSD